MLPDASLTLSRRSWTATVPLARTNALSAGAPCCIMTDSDGNC